MKEKLQSIIRHQKTFSTRLPQNSQVVGPFNFYYSLLFWKRIGTMAKETTLNSKIYILELLKISKNCIIKQLRLSYEGLSTWVENRLILILRPEWEWGELKKKFVLLRARKSSTVVGRGRYLIIHQINCLAIK